MPHCIYLYNIINTFSGSLPRIGVFVNNLNTIQRRQQFLEILPQRSFLNDFWRAMSNINKSDYIVRQTEIFFLPSNNKALILVEPHSPNRNPEVELLYHHQFSKNTSCKNQEFSTIMNYYTKSKSSLESSN